MKSTYASHSLGAMKSRFGCVSAESCAKKLNRWAVAAGVCLVLMGTTAFSATRTWKGGTSTAWATAANWNENAVPTSADDVVFDPAPTRQPTISAGTIIKTLTVGSTGNITITIDNSAAAVTLSLAGNNAAFTINSGGQLTLTTVSTGANAGTIAFSGVTPSSSVAGTLTMSGRFAMGGSSCSITVSNAAIVNINRSGSSIGGPILASTTFTVRSGGTVNWQGFGNSLFDSGTINLNSGSTFNATSSTGMSFSARTYGNLTLGGNQTYDIPGTNSLTIQNGLTIGAGSVVNHHNTSVGGIIFGGTATVNGTLNCDPTSVVSGAGTFSLSSGGTLGIGSTAGITSSGASGNIQVAGTRTFSTNANYSYNNSTPSAQVTGSGLPATVNNLTIANTAGVTLTASVAMNGILSLTAGTLTGNVTINGGGTIKGTGTLAGQAIINGTVAPGSSPGTLTTGNETWNGGGTYLWEVNDAAGAQGANPGWDYLNITGTLTIGATSGNKFTLDVTSLAGINPGDAANFTNTLSYSWRIAAASGGITGFDAAAFNVLTTHFSNSLAGSFSLGQSGDGKSLIVTYTPIPPLAIQCPADAQVQCGGSTAPSATGSATSSGGCLPVTITSSDAATPANCTGHAGIDRTWTATDSCSNSMMCVQHITFTDTNAPMITCPASKTVIATSIAGASVTYLAPAVTDNCGGTIAPVCNPPSGSTFPIGTNSVNCTATDGCGNQSQCNFDIIVLEHPINAYVDVHYAGKPDGTAVNFPDDGNAGPHTVGADAFATIQAGVNAIAPNGTLTVAPGTYPELVHVTAPMTINGANAGVDPRNSCNGGATRAAESIIDGHGTETAIEFDSSGITLDGFTIQNGTADAAHSGVDLHNGFDNNKVLNNIITNNSIGVFANCAGPLPTIIQKNRIDSNNLQCTPSPCSSEGAGIYVDASINLQILDNEITGHTNNNPLLIAATGAGSHTNLVVSGNNVHDNGCGCSAIYTLGITGGTFSKNTISSDATGLRLGSADLSIQVQNNAFVKASVGVRLVDDGFSFPANSDVHINGNSFDNVNVTTAVSRDAGNNGSDSDTVLDASGNWWGVSSSGTVPSRLDTSDGAIDYTPWLVSGTDTNADVCDGFQGDYSVVVVDAASPQSGTSGRIGEGIDLVMAGGTIRIVSGTYVETVDATAKSVTLAPGESPGLVTINGDLTLGASDTLELELAGETPGNQYDQVVVNGGVTLGGATLSITSTFAYQPCDLLTLIANDGTDPVSGTFNGLTNGSVITIGGQDFRLRYDRGTDSNDVVLILDTTPPTFDNCPVDQDLGCNPANVPECDPLVTASDNCGAAAVDCTFSDTPNPPGTCRHTRTLTYVATDAAGNTATCIQHITWRTDVTPPTFDNCPLDFDIGCSPTTIPECDPLVTAHDNCGTGAVSVACSFSDTASPPGTCSHTRTITYIATDGCGNSNTCVQHITWRTDTENPVFTNCPTATITLPCNSPPTCSNALALVSASDNCSASIIPACSPGTIITNGCQRTQTFSLIATDACSNSATCSITFTWTEDTTPPAFSPQPFADCSGQTQDLGCNPDLASIPHCLVAIGSTDTCGSSHVSCASQQTTNGCVVTRVVTYTADDPCRNTNICRRIFTWRQDTTAPTFTKCPGNINLGCNPATIPDCDTNSSNVAATDDCGEPPTITCSRLDFTNGCVRTRRLVYTATDLCGNAKTCTQNINWTVDTNAPVLVNCPLPTLDLGCNPTNVPTCSTYNVTAADTCGGTPTITCTNFTVTNGCARMRTIAYTATDSCGNSASCSQVVTWTVNSPPVLTGCPTPTLFMGCNPDLLTIPTCTNYTVTATDDCSTPSLTCTNVTVTNGCVRTRTLTWTATDDCGNTTNCSQVITWIIDNGPPTFTKCPPATIHLGCNPAVVPDCDTSPTNVAASDDCGVTITCSKSELVTGDGCVHDRTLTYTATDLCSNSVTCTQHIIWTTDTQPPVFTTCPTNIDLGCSPTVALPECNTNSSNVAAVDNCSLVAITCAIVDSTNGCVGTRRLIYTATDACGNSSNCVQTITWTTDTNAPVFTLCPANTNLGCNPLTLPVCDTSTNNVVATDDCGTPTITCSQLDFVNGCIHTRRFVYKATDSCGNSRTCTQNITWTVDTNAPALVNCPAATLTLGNNPTNIPTCATYNVTAADGCSTPQVSCSSVTVSNGCQRTRTLTWVARDACGNTNSCSQVITYTQDTPVTLTITQQGSNIVISWPVTCINYRLQQTSSLLPTSWTTVAQAPVIINNNYTVTIPIAGAATFYRLINP